MIPFEAQDPYPLVPVGLYTYAEAQQHSALVDAWLGLAAESVEKEIDLRSRSATYETQSLQQRWVGLPVQALLTPYTEFRAMLEHLQPPDGNHLVDLGAAYGRMGLVLARHFPKLSFLGIECEELRVKEGQRIFRAQAPDAKIELLCADLNGPGFKLPEADIYFIYDFGHRVAIEQTLQDLKGLALRRKIVVVGRGRGTRDAIEKRHPWLWDVVEPENRGNYSIYRS